MGVGRLVVFVEFDVFQLGPADHPLLLGDRQRIPRRHVVNVLLHVHIAGAGEVGILVADRGGADGQCAVRVLGAVDETQQVAVVEEAEAVHLVDHGDRAGHRLEDAVGQLEADVQLSARMWNNRSPGVAGAVCRGPFNSTNGCSSAGRGPENNRSQASEPIEAITDNCFGGSRKPIARTRPEISGSASCTVRFAALVDGDDEEDRGRRQRREDGLRLHGRHSADPSVNPAVADSDDVEHVGQRRRPLRIHRRLSVAVPCLRHGGRAAGRRRLHRTRRNRPLAGRPGRYFTVRAGSLVAWNLRRARRSVPDRRRRTPTAPTCGSSNIPTGW